VLDSSCPLAFLARRGSDSMDVKYVAGNVVQVKDNAELAHSLLCAGRVPSIRYTIRFP
jgi:hypothetical protein